MSIVDQVSYASRKYHKEIQRATDVLSRQFGITYFGTQTITPEGRWSLLTNRPEWVEHCADQQFYRHDPSLVHPDFYQPGISYVSAHTNPDFRSSIIKDAAELFDIDHCLGFIDKTEAGCEFTFFATSCRHASVFNTYISQYQRLRNYAAHFTAAHSRWSGEAADHGLDLTQLKTDTFFQDIHLFECAPLYQADGAAEQLFSRLAPREQDCLRHLLAGCTAKQTAKRLRISPRTVEEYLFNLKRKLGCHSQRELILLFRHLC